MSFGHNRTARGLARQLILQLSPDEYEVLQNQGHASLPGGDSYIPDVAVVPSVLTAVFLSDPRRFETYSDPLPFVAEIWSPSTGNYEVDVKIPGYQRRGDAEIWRIHPFDRTVTIWRISTDGHYVETLYRSGVLELQALPGIHISLDELFGPQ